MGIFLFFWFFRVLQNNNKMYLARNYMWVEKLSPFIFTLEKSHFFRTTLLPCVSEFLVRKTTFFRLKLKTLVIFFSGDKIVCVTTLTRRNKKIFFILVVTIVIFPLGLFCIVTYFYPPDGRSDRKSQHHHHHPHNFLGINRRKELHENLQHTTKAFM